MVYVCYDSANNFLTNQVLGFKLNKNNRLPARCHKVVKPVVGYQEYKLEDIWVKINSKIVTGFYTVALSLAFSAPILAADTVETENLVEGQTTQDTEQTDEAEQARATKLTQADDNDGVLEEVVTTGTP